MLFTPSTSATASTVWSDRSRVKQSGGNISVKVQRGKERQTIYGNPDQIYRILDNLLRNAFRYHSGRRID